MRCPRVKKHLKCGDCWGIGVCPIGASGGAKRERTLRQTGDPCRREIGEDLAAERGQEAGRSLALGLFVEAKATQNFAQVVDVAFGAVVGDLPESFGLEAVVLPSKVDVELVAGGHVKDERGDRLGQRSEERDIKLRPLVEVGVQDEAAVTRGTEGRMGVSAAHGAAPFTRGEHLPIAVRAV